MAIKETGVKGYLLFLKTKQPRIYHAIKHRLAPAGLPLAGLGADAATVATSSPATKSLSDTLKELVNGAAQLYLTKNQLDAQKKITDMQIQRAGAGLAPLDINMSDYGLTPTAQVGMTGDTKTFLMYGGIGLAVLFLFGQLNPRKRR